MKKIILIGGGGHCKSCIDVIESTKKFKIIGIIDKKERLNSQVLNYPIIGSDEYILDLSKQADCFLITLGHIGESPRRKALFEFLEKNKLTLASIVSPFATVSKHASINSGTIVMHHSIINADAKVGKNCIINTNSLIEHDTHIGDHSHVATGATINGNVSIEKNCFIGSNSTINLGITIHENSIIASQSLVTKSLTKSGNYRGIPVNEF